MFILRACVIACVLQFVHDCVYMCESVHVRVHAYVCHACMCVVRACACAFARELGFVHANVYVYV
jgi:hypothetical protein